MPEGWKEHPQKARQKDVDARWTKKNGERYYGCKNHVKVDITPAMKQVAIKPHSARTGFGSENQHV